MNAPQDKQGNDLEFDLLRDIEAFVDAPLPPVAQPVHSRPQGNSFPGLIDAIAQDTPDTAPSARPTMSAPMAAPVSPQAAPASASTAGAPVAGGLLDRLKREAAAKLALEDQGLAALQAHRLQNSEALDRLFKYFNELCQQLNVVKPACPVSYNLLGLASLEGMSWQEGRADYRLQLAYQEDRILDYVTVHFVLASAQTQTLERDAPTHESLRIAMTEWNLAFSSTETRNAKGAVERVTFRFPSAVRAGMTFRNDAAAGAIRMQLNNVRRLGRSEFLVPPQAVNAEMLEELGQFLFGEANGFDRKFKRVA
jgi:hypothetical protein